MADYLWINPVVRCLYDKEALENAVREKGFQTVECEQDQAEIVRQKYHREIAGSEICVVDMRCPSASQYIRVRYGAQNLMFPSIHPILIHCARELSARYARPGNRLVITTPCTALEQLGESLQLKHTFFQTWLAFSQEQALALEHQKLRASPIPPGFFSEFGEQVQSLRKKEEFDAFFMSSDLFSKRIVEALYCENGCHNGDGVPK